jgi:hypothetical protein
MKKTVGSAALSLAVLLTGCGGDDGSGMDPGDCENVGHGGVCLDRSPWQLEEASGLSRIELIYDYTDGSGTPAISTFAYFFEDQTPPRQPLEGEPMGDSACVDVTAGDIYDTGPHPESQEIANTRSYIDIGDSMTLGNPDGDLTLAKAENTVDGSNLIEHDIVYNADVSVDELAFDGLYDFQLNGGGFTPEDLQGGVSVTGTPYDRNDLYMPPDFESITPTNQGYQNIEMNSSEDYVVEWSTPEIADNAPELAAFWGFVDPETFEIDYFCSGKNNDSLTIPSNVLSTVKENQPNGLIIHGIASHVAYNLNQSRYDLSGINCKLGAYSVQ